MDNNQNQERRVNSRILFDSNTCISQGNKQWQAKLIDLSLKGLLIEQPQNWDADNSQLMDANIQLNEDVSIQMSISWRHSENAQLGFQCMHIDIDSISHLRRLLELNLGDTSLLERELAALG
jgi:PilZ domain